MGYKISKVLRSLMVMRDRTSGDDAQACYDMMAYHLPPRAKAVYRHVNAYGGMNARDIAAGLNLTHDHACGQLLYLFKLGLVRRERFEGQYYYYATKTVWTL